MSAVKYEHITLVYLQAPAYDRDLPGYWDVPTYQCWKHNAGVKTMASSSLARTPKIFLEITQSPSA